LAYKLKAQSKAEQGRGLRARGARSQRID